MKRKSEPGDITIARSKHERGKTGEKAARTIKLINREAKPEEKKKAQLRKKVKQVKRMAKASGEAHIVTILVKEGRSLKEDIEARRNVAPRKGKVGDIRVSRPKITMSAKP